jgi:DNA primase
MSKVRLTDEQRAERLERVHAELDEAVTALASSDGWAAFLTAARRFHRYSFGNVLLIAVQRPDATQVAGFSTWRALGRSVNRGAKGIAILAPVARRIDVEDTETGEMASVRLVRHFRVAFVFDVSDTTGAASPEPPARPELLEGEAPDGMWADLVRRVEALGFTIELAPEIAGHPGANGLTELAKRVVTVATEGRSPASRCRTLIHELAHATLHSSGAMTREVAEIEAESVAFLVADGWGLDASPYSVPYLVDWASDPMAIRATADRVIKTAQSILSDREGADGAVAA